MTVMRRAAPFAAAFAVGFGVSYLLHVLLDLAAALGDEA